MLKHRVLFSISFLILCFLACTSNNHIHLSDEMTDHETQLLHEINRIGKKKKAEVSLKNDRTIIAKNIFVSEDSTTFTVADVIENRSFDIDITWYSQNKNKTFTFPNSEIDFIRFDYTALGAFQGLAWGALSGAALGNLYGRYEYAHMPYNEDPPPDRVVRQFYSAIGGAVGGFFGLIYGSSTQSKHFYYFVPSDHE